MIGGGATYRSSRLENLAAQIGFVIVRGGGELVADVEPQSRGPAGERAWCLPSSSTFLRAAIAHPTLALQ
ncbi:Hypothetical predicted protein [Marmota monax]|uniref:Uncharacterized protein n=1 Tax=Marmota monax TaxID=9995 RepID=A0A5E4BZU8_MARMO|nr:hypothetical protein GHT09_017588 [Marmota monax]VTJ75177.1 Hypothetical predicted protein [Marmota monax]